MISLGKYRLFVVNLLFAFAISLVINFSYFILWIISSGQPPEGPAMSSNMYFSNTVYLIIYQVIYYALFAFVLISILLTNVRNEKSIFWQRLLLCVFISVVMYLLSPVYGRNEEVIFTFQSRRMINPIQVLRATFLLIVSVLYAKIYELIYSQQNILFENQQLKNENLETRYNMLMGQINPHFFFNSLNSLSMLVRKDQKSQALSYVDNLSDTFRYILQNGQQGMTTLGEELSFMDSYKYLYEIRYADKLFFDIKVDKVLYDKRLPSMSLQPLIENAVKHNVISSQSPFTISMYESNGFLCVGNPIYAKIKPEQGLGIGLKNLSSRYKLLVERDIEIVDENNTFVVKLPLS